MQPRVRGQRVRSSSSISRQNEDSREDRAFSMMFERKELMGVDLTSSSW